jgi:hypothetical protein
MGEETRKILEMLKKGKISVDEAERLLKALGKAPAAGNAVSRRDKPKYLRVLVEPAPGNKKGDRVNVRVPMNLIRAGLKWAALIPQHARGKVDEALKEQGIDVDFDKIKPSDLEEIIVHLNDLQVEVDGNETVRVFCE